MDVIVCRVSFPVPFRMTIAYEFKQTKCVDECDMIAKSVCSRYMNSSMMDNT